MTGLTRGPLPAEVYWRRRLALLTAAVLVVLVIARLMPGGGHDPKAATVAHVTSPSHHPSGTASTTPSASATPTAAATATLSPTPTAPPSPTAVCSDDDISVTPSVTDAQSTKPVVITLAISSITTPACLWDVSPATLQLKITSGSDRVWSTLDCPDAVPNQRVVVQRGVPTDINIRWNTRRSEAGCPPQTNWVSLGYYHATVAALGGQPADVQFQLTKPTAAAPTALPSAVTTASAPPAAPETAPVTTPAAPTAPTTGAVPNRHLRKGLKAD